MSAAYVHNLKLDAGSTFEQIYEIRSSSQNAVDLSGFSAVAQIRKHRGSTSAVQFTIGFPDRKNGKIKLTIPSWISSGLKSGRYVYDVLLTNNAGGAKTIVLEGAITVKSHISTGCNFALPTSAQRLCIAVIDESDSQTFAEMSTAWATFRSSYPRRTFYLLYPDTDNGGIVFGDLVDANDYNELKCPQDFINATTVNVGRLISEDGD